MNILKIWRALEILINYIDLDGLMGPNIISKKISSLVLPFGELEMPHIADSFKKTNINAFILYYFFHYVDNNYKNKIYLKIMEYKEKVK